MLVEPDVLLLDGPDQMAVQLAGDGSVYVGPRHQAAHQVALGGFIPHIREQ